jgi:diguanylate cyclase (GGDEF)-like protein
MHLEQELARCRRENVTMAVIVLDLDGFKEVNDCFGHLAGDKVLKLFANSMRQVCRTYDYAARMGGDEFVIVASNITPDAIEDRARLLSALAQEAGREVCGRDFLSLSLGAAFYPEDGLDAERLLSEADRRMYAVKTVHHQDTGRAPIQAVREGDELLVF